MIKKILEYEKKILEYRSELNELIQAQSSKNDNQELLEAKIDYLKQELSYIDNQLNILKASIGASDVRAGNQQISTSQDSNSSNDIAVTNESNVPNTESSKSIYETPIRKNVSTKTSQSKSKDTSYTYYDMGNIKATDNNRTAVTSHDDNNIAVSHNSNPTKPSSDLENLMGKNLMGIFASVLIFISFIVFATVVLPNLSDAIKMLAMYLVSFAFLGVGLYLQKKDNTNKLYLSISGCGIGAIYISLLISNVYFNAIGDITMYLLIFVWALFVCYLSRTKSWIFQIIGQIGITISILFGAVLCTETEDWTKLLFLIIFFIASQTMFFVAHYEDEYWDNIVNIIGQLAGLFILCTSIPVYYITADYIIILSMARVFLILFALTHITLGFFIFRISEKSRMLLAITNICYFLLLSHLFRFDGKPLYLIGFALLSLIAMEYKFALNRFSELKIMQIFYSLVLIVRMYQLNSLDGLDTIVHYFSFSLLAIPFAVYGFIARDKIYKAFSMIYFALFVFNFDMNNTAQLILGIGIICLFCYFLKEMQYSTKIKTFLYFITILFALFTLSPIVDSFTLQDETKANLIFAAICIIHAIAIKSPFGKNWIDGSSETTFTVVSSIVNAILMLFSMVFVQSVSDPTLHFFAILIALMLFMINSKNLLQREGLIWGIYVGIKFTVYMNVILDSFSAPDFAISICCLLFAIVSIVIGFMMKYKSLRVYGLGLSLLSIVKLIMIDMSYESSLSRAFSFFICGILCFVISSIYNYVDKKMSK